MIAMLDVGYTGDHAIAACVVAADWTADRAVEERVARIAPVAAYEPGMFYRRELPCLLAVLREVRATIATIVIDGYVTLDGDRPGLGAHLHRAVQRPVIGVAKTEFRGAPALQVTRGQSSKPLFVSAVGMDAKDAAEVVRAMHGAYRVPTLLRRVDRLSRG